MNFLGEGGGFSAKKDFTPLLYMDYVFYKSNSNQ